MRGSLVPELTKIDQQIVAICDVDKLPRDSAFQAIGLTNVKAYHDYRELLDKETGVDAVIIATPDHWRVPICQAALQAGEHVYCEKRLAHSVADCRALEQLATRHPKLATQTGNQGCSTENLRGSFELIQSGLLGNITEVHVWHLAHSWPKRRRSSGHQQSDSGRVRSGFRAGRRFHGHLRNIWLRNIP